MSVWGGDEMIACVLLRTGTLPPAPPSACDHHPIQFQVEFAKWTPICQGIFDHRAILRIRACSREASQGVRIGDAGYHESGLVHGRMPSYSSGLGLQSSSFYTL